jgi:hypothetical protein
MLHEPTAHLRQRSMETPEDGHRFAQHAYLRGHLVLLRHGLVSLEVLP